ncbi:MAG: hypothetical protein JO112_23690, partial [Planctomycetes bacterium]|nr:hypothetical protein [Planctomycetota bacterium]
VAIRRRRPVPDDHLGNCLEADLVVDASGRGSRAPQWLKALGYTPPEDTVVNAFLGYASRVYQSPPNPPAEWKTLYLQSKPPVGKRTGLIAPVEGGRWMVTLSGRGGDYPPTDEAGFLDFARSLPSSMLYEAIRQAEPLSPIAGYRATENRLRHFERLARWPEGFVVLGDAACAFNPVYGQGMTTAALGAVTLDQCLRSQPAGPARVHDGLARRFQRQLAAVNVTPWLLATGEDHRYPTTVGGRPSRLTRLQQHYVDQVIRLSTRDPQTRLTFLKVLHLIQSPRALFGPRVLLGLLRQAFSFAESEQRSVSSPVHAERRGVSSPVQIVPVQPAPAGSCRAARPGLGNVL